MGSKKKTLPRNFEELLSNGNLDELKDVFKKCEPDARGGYGKQTALAFDNCPHELAKWLVEQGADLEASDTWENTPLHNRSRSRFGNIKSLLELGADINIKNGSGNTPLHTAAISHNVDNTEILLAHGAQIDALNSSGYTPLEQALMTCNNVDIVNTVKISLLYLDSGIQITPKMKELVIEIGKRFEFHRTNFNKETVNEVSDALEELYSIFGVGPVAKRNLHDGKSLITTNAKTWQEQH